MSGEQHYTFRYTAARSLLSRTGRPKRKRNEYLDSDVSDEEHGQRNSSQVGLAELLPEDARQRQVAGLPADENVPGDGFPHRSQDYVPKEKVYIVPSAIQKEMASLNPPLLDHPRRHTQLNGSRSSLKQQHINAIYNIVHRCFLEKDFVRAERAFKLLLQTEIAGKLPDLRKKNLWGIGAEILLHRKAQVRRMRGVSDEDHPGFFDREGLRDVRLYYEKLMIQFPYNAQNPHAISSAHMYPIFFGFWIASVDAEYHMALRSIRKEHRRADEHYSFEDLEEMENVRMQMLARANEIDSRLDEVLQSIPYSDDPVLWDLKGNVCLWLEDLSNPFQEEEQTQELDTEDAAKVEYEHSTHRSANKAFAKANLYRQAQKSAFQAKVMHDSELS